MPQIKPFDLVPDLPDELNDILESTKIIAPKSSKDLDLNAARTALNNHGAGIDNVAQTIANIMQRGDSNAGQLKAAEMALRVHGILNELDNKQIPQITINVVGSENKTLINLVLPQI